jgi:serine protease Do
LFAFSQGKDLIAQDQSAQDATTQVDSDQGAGAGNSLQVMQWTAVAFRQAAARIRPCLVTIESFGGVSAVQGRIGGIRKQGEGNTTGVMISPDGWIITSTFNFIQKPPIITVVTSDGQRHVATMHGRDDTRKLCLLKIDKVADMPTPELADATNLQVGQWAISVGVGFGDVEPAISSGIISALNRVGGRAIQTDANTSPACYGGPLVDIEGKLIGICVPLNPQSQAIGAGVEWYDSGIGFAVPLSGHSGIIERMQRGEVIAPAFIGVQTKPAVDQSGLEIEQVVAGSAAEKAGLQVGDVIVQLAGKPMRDLLALRQLLNRYDAGEQVELTFVRGAAAPQTVTLALGTAVNADETKQLEPPKIR